MKDSLYHALRIAFSSGRENIPWNYFLHAIREGLDINPTYRLTHRDLAKYPELNEFMEKLKEISNEIPVPTAAVDICGEDQLGLS